MEIFDSVLLKQAEFEGKSEELSSKSEVFSVSGISRLIKQDIELNFSNISVRGEVLGLKKHTSGHIYFSLKDSEEEAVLNAICWRGTKTSMVLEEGAEIIVGGRVTTYPSRSNYQIIVSKIRAAGEGSLFKLLQERKKRFAEEGLFDKHRSIPQYPKVIGVVTSQTGAVIHDILHRISERWPCDLILWPVAVQGETAAAQVAGAIIGFNELKGTKRPDILIVARGGGSLEDLWAFNEEIVVKAAFESSIPLISAVGHETDTTLIDYAADIRAPTPTAAAEIATPSIVQVISSLRDRSNRQVRALNKTLETLEFRLKTNKVPSVEKWLSDKVLFLDDRYERLVMAVKQILQKNVLNLQYLKRLIRAPYNLISFSELNLKNIVDRSTMAVRKFFNNTEQKLDILCTSLQQSSYYKILKKGFCLVTSETGNVVASAEKIKKEAPEKVILNFSDGVVFSKPVYK